MQVCRWDLQFDIPNFELFDTRCMQDVVKKTKQGFLSEGMKGLEGQTEKKKPLPAQLPNTTQAQQRALSIHLLKTSVLGNSGLVEFLDPLP